MWTRYLMLSSLAAAGFAASFPDYPIKRITEYSTTVENSGVVVAAVAVEDRKDQHQYFGMDLRTRGYIPVFLIVENRTPDGSVLLSRDSLTYGSGSTVPGAAKSSKSDKVVNAAAKIPSVYTIMWAIRASKDKARRQHLLETELQSSTLSPRTSVHGFIFVPAPRNYTSRKKIQLTIPFARSGSDDVVTIDLTL
jgi:hypothetical protein